MIQTGNSRYAWVAFYKRDMFESINSAGVYSFSFAPYAQVIVIAVQARNSDSFSPNDLTPGTGSLDPSDPTRANAAGGSFTFTGAQLLNPLTNTSGNTATIIGGIQLPGNAGDATDRSAPGAFVIIAGDNLNTNNPYHGQLNGHVYRLGSRFSNQTTGNYWEFAPGFGLTGSDQDMLRNKMGGNVAFNVYMLGMGHDTNTPANFSGPAMDVAVYSSFIPCSTN